MDIRHYDELRPAFDSMQTHEIVQRHIPGHAASVIVIGCETDHTFTVMPAVWQSIQHDDHDESTEDCLRYLGGMGPLPARWQSRVHSLANGVAASLPGKFTGFLGIDFVLGHEVADDFVIEVNARMTSSYLGVRQMVDENLTRRLFEPADQYPVIRVADESIHWTVS